MVFKRRKTDVDKAREASSTEQPVSDASAATPSQSTEVQQTEAVPELGRRPAVFEFGGPVQVGELTMLGNCMASDPDEIQACVWRVEKVSESHEVKPRAKYHIEF